MTDQGDYIKSNKEFFQRLFKQKETFHRSRARLPIEEKIKILIELQKLTLTMHPRKDENDLRMVWRI